MAIGIYKAGQGYWVRVLTASMFGVLTLATSAWVWGQTQIAVEKLPRSVWTLPLRDTQGTTPAPGTRVTLIAKPVSPPPAATTPPAPEAIGTAEVSAYDEQNRALRVRAVEMTRPTADPGQTGQVIVGSVGSPSFSATVVGLPSSAAAVEPVAVQGSVVALVMLLGAGLTYWLVAVRTGSVEFLIATDTEMKKVNWSNRKDIWNSTVVVIGACFLIALALFAFDWIFQFFFRLIGVLTA